MGSDRVGRRITPWLKRSNILRKAVLPRTALDPPSPVTRVIRLALQVLLRSPTPGGASLPISLSLIGSLTWFKTRTPTGLLGSHMNLPRSEAEGPLSGGQDILEMG